MVEIIMLFYRIRNKLVPYLKSSKVQNLNIKNEVPILTVLDKIEPGQQGIDSGAGGQGAAACHVMAG